MSKKVDSFEVDSCASVGTIPCFPIALLSVVRPIRGGKSSIVAVVLRIQFKPSVSHFQLDLNRKQSQVFQLSILHFLSLGNLSSQNSSAFQS